MDKKMKIFNNRISHYPIKEKWTKEFKEYGAEYIGKDCYTEDDLIKYAKDVDILEEVIGVHVGRKYFNSAKKLRAIVRHGIGYENIDIEAAKDFNIPVSNTPGYCIDEVSTHCILLLLTMARKLIFWDGWVKDKKWKIGEPPFSGLNSINGENIGIIGFGKIGKSIYKKIISFEPKLYIYDPQVNEDKKEFNINRQLTLGFEQGFDGQNRCQHVAFIIRCPPGIYTVVCDHWLKRRLAPELYRIHRLDVEVAVDQNCRSFGRMQPLSVDHRMTVGGQYLNLLDSGNFKTIGNPISGPADVIGMFR